MQATVYNLAGEEVQRVELDEAVFGVTPNMAVIQQAVLRQQANARQGTHDTKTRSEVRGGGKKPWRQKGTGRARVGEIRNPLWRKGGTVFGPQPRSYEYELPKKVRLGALRAALAQKVQDGAIVVVDRLELAERKTKAASELLKRLGATGKTLVIDVHPDDTLALSARNLAGVKVVPSGRVTARDIMDTSRVIATREALEKLQESLRT